MTSREIPSLDGLRAISISLVIVSHSFGPVTEHGFLFNLLLKHGGLGVRIFFIISGFLITSLCLREIAKFGSLSLRLFYARRALRIVPAFYFYAGAMVVLSLIGRLSIDPANWIYVFTWTMNYSANPSWFVAHLWSLSVEEQFYLAWPLALKALRPKAWVAIAFAAIFCGILLRAAQAIADKQWIDPQRLPYAFPFVAAPLAMGCLLAIYESRIQQWVQGWQWRWIVPVLVLTLLFETATEMQDGAFRPIAELLVNAILTLAVAWCVFMTGTPAAGFLNAPAAVFAGKLSYSLYLWQELWVWRVDRPLYTIPRAWIAIFVCALISYYIVERPFLGLRQKFRRAAA